MRVNSDLEANRRRQSDRIAEGDVYYWKNGEGVVFDDTYMHEAFNDSDRVRVVLFLDVRRKMRLKTYVKRQTRIRRGSAWPSWS